MRLFVVAIVGAAVFGTSGCDKPKERARDEAAIAAAIEQARREDAEADRQMRERADQRARTPEPVLGSFTGMGGCNCRRRRWRGGREEKEGRIQPKESAAAG